MTTMRYFYVVVVFFGIFACCSCDCPPAELIVPCTCTVDNPSITCYNITEMEVLNQVFDRSADYSFAGLNLYNSSILYLPASKIAFKHVQQLLVMNSTMAALFDSAIVEGNELKIIWAWNVLFQRGVGWELFRNLKNLESFRSVDSEIRSLGKKFTDNIPPSLIQLALVNAKTRKIQHNAFVNLKKLSVLEISGGDIKSVSRAWFPKPSPLTIFNFRGNKLTSLPDDIFSDMPDLDQIILDDNQLTSLSETIFGSVYDKLFHLYVTENPINCDCSVRWMLNKINTKQGVIQGKCATPANRKGQNVGWLAYDDFAYCEH